MIKTVFFDIGNVIFNEDIIHFKNYELLWMYLRKQDAQWTFENLMKVREKWLRNTQDPNTFLSLAKEFLPESQYTAFIRELHYFSRRYRERYIRMIPGMIYVIRSLYHYYSLGIIANQSVSVNRLLEKYNLKLYFKAIAISEELKMQKPDSRIFLWALEKTKTPPQEAVMIGDRLDYDILPAKKLGMQTILARFTLHAKGIFPQNYRERLYFTSIEKYPPWRQTPRNKSELPTAIVKSVDEILRSIQAMESSAKTGVGGGQEEEEAQISLWDIFKEISGEEQ